MKNIEKEQSLKKIANLITDLQAELFKLTGSDLFTPNSQAFFASQQEHSLDSKIDFVLIELGIPSNISGYEMIKSALKYLHDAKKKVYYTKSLYPDIAKKHSKTATSVERNIRHAILLTCKKGNKLLLKKLFPNAENIEEGVPVNVFLSRILEYVKKGY